MTRILSIGVAIPAYNNPVGLRDCLNSIQQIAPELSNHITVVDDSGSGIIAKSLKEDFQDIRWIIHQDNQGFGKAANRGVLESNFDLVILLNDDTTLVTNPVSCLRRMFAGEQVFAATFQSLNHNNEFREGRKRLIWAFGFPKILHNPKDQPKAMKDFIDSAYAVGGHAAFDRKKFLELGGFDPLFDPFYWEDVDLCQRALNRQWLSVYLPDCKVMHGGHSAIRSTYENKFIQNITQRNKLLFAFRHSPLILRPILWLSILFRLLQGLVQFDTTFLKSLLYAFKSK